jgi:tRNA nucleotidyltransferase (CCA-adding enzyme)
VLLPACQESAHALDAWRALRAELRRRPPLSVADLAVDGRDLLRLGMKPGPRFGEVLDRLLARVLEDPGLNRRHTLAALVREWNRREAPGAGQQEGEEP